MDTKLYVEKLYVALGTQPHDPSWLIAAAELLSIDIEVLKKPNWYLSHWEASWGKLEFLAKEEGTAFIWHRTDGSEPVADLTPNEQVPYNIQAARFGLMAKIVETLPELMQLSYVKVGWPECWTRCTLTFNDQPIEEVITADAILGTCEFYVKSKGKRVLSIDGDEFVTAKVAGKVRIIVNPETRSFF